MEVRRRRAISTNEKVQKDMGLVSDSDKDDDDDEGEDVAEGSEAETPKKNKEKKKKKKTTKKEHSPKRRESDAEGSDKNNEESTGKKGKKRAPKQAKLTGADARKVMTPLDAQAHMVCSSQIYSIPNLFRIQEKLWERELPFLSLIWSSIHTDASSPATKQPPSAQMFFFQLIPVTPPRFRPTSEQAAEHPQSVHYSKILQLTQSMRALGEDHPEGAEDSARPVATVNTWEELQVRVPSFRSKVTSR